MNLVRITDHALTRKDDIFLPEKTILRLARRIEKERNGGQETASVPVVVKSESFDPACPFRFIDPKTVETIEQDANLVRSCTLPNNAYHVLKHLCQRSNCCATIKSVADGVDISEEAVVNAAKKSINPTFRQCGIAKKISRENGFIFIVCELPENYQEFT